MERIVTPLNPAGFAVALSEFDLLRAFPTLVSRIRQGFPVGNFVPLSQSYIFRNHLSCPLHTAYVKAYLEEEVSLQRMSGPFTVQALQVAFRGLHFQTSPLGTVPKVGSPPGELRIIRDASFRGDAPLSVNDQINPDEQSTRWGKATDMARIVGTASFA